MNRLNSILKYFAPMLVFAFAIGLLNCASASVQVPKHVVIFFSSETKNELFVCGCKEKLGGLARRKTAIKNCEYPHIVVDVGSFSKGSKRFEKLKTETLLKCYNNIGCDVINVGTNEYRLGDELVRYFEKIADAPFISANVADKNRELVFPPYKIITVDGLKLGVIGVVSSAFVKDEVRLGYRILNIEEQAAKFVPEVSKQCDLVILLANARDNEIENIAAANPGIDVILGGRTFNYSENDRPTRLGNTIIHKNGGMGKYLGRLRLDLQRATPVKIKDYEGFNVHLGDDLVDDPEILKILDEYRTRLKTTDFTKPAEDSKDGTTGTGEKKDSSDVSDDDILADADLANETPAYLSYTGALKCAECHKEIYNKWRRTRHANAFITLAAEQQDKNPQCFPCHTVGFKRIGGFVDFESTPKLVGVQCENCHGGGAAHVIAMKDPAKSGPAITSRVPEFFCKKCHNDEWDAEFNMEEKLPLVDHGTDGTE